MTAMVRLLVLSILAVTGFLGKMPFEDAQDWLKKWMVQTLMSGHTQGQKQCLGTEG